MKTVTLVRTLDVIEARQREKAERQAIADRDAAFMGELLAAERVLRGLAGSLDRGYPSDAPPTLSPAVAAARAALAELAKLRVALAGCPYARALVDRLHAADDAARAAR